MFLYILLCSLICFLYCDLEFNKNEIFFISLCLIVKWMGCCLWCYNLCLLVLWFSSNCIILVFFGCWYVIWMVLYELDILIFGLVLWLYRILVDLKFCCKIVFINFVDLFESIWLMFNFFFSCRCFIIFFWFCFVCNVKCRILCLLIVFERKNGVWLIFL